MSRGAAENRFCNVQVRTWDDPDFCQLSAPPPNAQTLWMYLLSGPYTTRVPGVVFGGRAAMAEALSWSQEDFDRCFAEIAAKGMAIADWRARVVYLPKAFSQQSNWPHSPSVCVTWRKVLNDLPECELVYRIDHDLRLLLLELGEQFLRSYVDGKRADSKPIQTNIQVPTQAPAQAGQSAVSSAPFAAVQQAPHPRAHAREGMGTGTDRVSEKSDTWTPSAFSALWSRVTSKSGVASGELLINAAARCEASARAAGKDDVAAHAEALVRALPRVLAWLKRQQLSAPALSISAFVDDRHFSRCEEVVAGRLDPDEAIAPPATRGGARPPDENRPRPPKFVPGRYKDDQS